MPALVIQTDAAVHQVLKHMMNVEPKISMENASVIQTAIHSWTVVKISTALTVINALCLLHQIIFICLQSEEPVQMLASHNVVMIQVMLDSAMSTLETQMVDVHAISSAMQGMTAVQMH